MDIEQLTKHQIVLLTLLVSFMTSIATGIVTVSLMNQAPPEITHTINRVVQQTVEKIVPVVGTSTTQFIPKQTADAADVITTARRSIIRITAKGDNKLIARGIIISTKGTALTDKGALDLSGITSFSAILPSGVRVPITAHASQNNGPIEVLDLVVGTTTGFVPIPIANTPKLRLGQSVFRIGGLGEDSVAEGIVAMIPNVFAVNNPVIEATVSSITPGSLLLDTAGNAIGLSTNQSLGIGGDYYSLIIKNDLPATKP